jgi:predicted ATPase
LNLPVTRLWIQKYRSLFDISLSVQNLTVIRGENAAGKTNLYRALVLLRRGAHGQLANSLLDEGGMPSAYWAGASRTSKKVAKRMVVGIQLDDLSYELSLGLPSPAGNASFVLDPEIKEERAWVGNSPTRHSLLLDRSGQTAFARNADHESIQFNLLIGANELALAQLGEPHLYPELFSLRHRLQNWRFYHSFPTDGSAPARRPQPGVRTPVLSDDGHDLAAALATILDNRDGRTELLHDAIETAFPGTSLEVSAHSGIFAIQMHFPGMLRPMNAIELSDGTLQLLYLAAALLTGRPPEFLVLNEPETSLHPGLTAALAPLIVAASHHSQIMITTHSAALSGLLTSTARATEVQLVRGADGSTKVVR